MSSQFRFLSYSDLDWKGKKIILRVDSNVPFSADGEISNDFRIKTFLSTLKLFLEHNCRIIIISHLSSNNQFSLRKCAERLQFLLKREVVFIPHDENFIKQTGLVPDAPIVMLDNLRLHSGEEKNDPALAKILSGLGDLFINEAFSCSHREHSSIVSLPSFFPGNCGAGPLFLKELESLSLLLSSPLHPRCAIVGGAKLKTKIPLIKSLKDWAEEIIIVGRTANSFLKVIHNASQSSQEEEEPFLMEILSILEEVPGLILPSDGIVKDGNTLRVCTSSEICKTDGFFDLGPQSIDMIQNCLKKQKTIFWNGPAGAFEKEEFSKGTVEIARALAKEDAQTFVAGGDTISAIYSAGSESGIDHFLNGGGASLTFLQCRSLPGIRALEEQC
ncbi:phosphoglycerate kinase [Candidatus Similichlamydia epinepheli]|uniref:phosphoglycerate kinase n=1 Tax=Candidatus Similichlamydia epinepheli TaxID=1903953 RepID=UPI000D362942|nr:phosphoglycerate kinase [Candidatus Similichlamydia epinepheli]